MSADARDRVDEGRIIVRTGLADVVIGDGHDFSAVPVAIAGELGGATTQLGRSSTVDERENARNKYVIDHD